MDSSCCKISTLSSAFVIFLYFISFVCQVQSLSFNNTNDNDSRKMESVRALLGKLNKPYVKTFQSSDGDIIDCVPSHLQPAFDHPLLKGQKPILMEPVEMPEGDTHTEILEQEYSQFWAMSYEYSCPENTVPIRRTTEEDVLRAKSVKTFGRKLISTPDGDISTEYAEGTLGVDNCFGAAAVINVWTPKLEDPKSVYSGSRIMILREDFILSVGWQVNLGLYGDTRLRLTMNWNNNRLKEYYCYNLVCPGFVQTSNKVALGISTSPTSSYNGKQYESYFVVRKEPTSGNWILTVNEISVGYWPGILFPDLNVRALVYFGGVVKNYGPGPGQTKTPMGSGHLPAEGHKKAAYFRKLTLISSNGDLTPVPNLRLSSTNKLLYDIQFRKTTNNVWGSYIYYGGPGKT